MLITIRSATPIVKWFALLWTAIAIGIVVLSNVMIAERWAPVAGVLPFDVQDSWKVALLLAPGAVAAIVQWVLQRELRAEEGKYK